MGYELAIALIVGVVLYAVAYLYYGSGGDMEQDNASPATLDEFSVTQSNEGSAIPLIYGRKRTRGNVLWYGNLMTEAVWSGGGGSDDPDPVIIGYKYYLDVWQSVCIGPATLVAYYVDNDDDLGITSSGETWNDGSTYSFPTEPGQYAAPLFGTAHIFWEQWLVGENRTRLPTVHFVVEHYPTGSGLSYIEETNGCNPAAIIYDLLIRAQATNEDIDIASFQAANTYWHNAGYGLNMSFSRQVSCREAIAAVLKQVGGVFSVTNENKFYIKAFDPDEAAAATIETEKFLNFAFVRKSWSDTYNDFRATFVDASNDYSKRTVAVRNVANFWLTGKKKQLNVDLNAFRDIDQVSQRLWEVMKTQSYPFAEFDFATNLEFYSINVGDVVEIVNDDYGIVSAYIRIMSKDVSEYDQNRVGFKGSQMVEREMDTNYSVTGGTEWEEPDQTITPIVNQQVIELPFISGEIGYGVTYLLLAERPHSWETSFVVIKSYNGTNYETQQVAHRWAQYGTLDEAYVETPDIDDEIGILYTPSREDPSFDSISRAELFSLNRLAYINGEFFGFQTVTPEGPSSIRLTGVVRRLFNTNQDFATHASGSTIWLFEYPRSINNVMMSELATSFYLKFLPSFVGVTLDASDATQILVTAATVLKPFAPTRIKAVRTGTSVAIEWWPATQISQGAGAVAADGQVDQYPFAFNGQFQWWDSISGTYPADAVTSTTIVRAGSFTFRVRMQDIASRLSDWAELTIGAADGTYIGPDA
ncbi:MAG: hypothetical protein DRJ03_01375 [Chloroflexi bacterium]|nr:MAG: hypothetical protein DRJ03_01375 [Chloroflexota bacterium]